VGRQPRDGGLTVANFYDVNAAIAKPNLLATIQTGYAFGTQQRQMREEEARQNELRTLTAPAVGGDLDAQDRMLALDPERAKQAMGVQQIRMTQLKGGMDFLKAAMESGNPQRIAAAEAQVGPYLSRVAGKPWQPGMLTSDPAAFEAAYAKIAMVAQSGMTNVQSTYVDEAGNRIAIMRDGSTQVLGRNDPGMANQTITVTGPNGEPIQMTFNKRSGRYERAAMGEPAPAPQAGPQDVTAAIAAEANRMIASGVPAAQVDEWAAKQGQQFTPPNVQYLPPGQTPAEKAAAEAEAKARVEAQYAPETAAAVEGAKIDAQLDRAPEQATADANRERLIAEGKAAAERAAAAPGAIATMQNTLDSIDAMLASEDLGSVVGLGSINPLNYIPGSKGRGLIARAEQVSGQAFLAAFNQLKGGGAITEREGAAATAAMARLDRAQGEADYRQALNDLRDAILPAIERQRAALNGGNVQAGGGAQGGYTIGQIIEAGGKRYRVTGLSDPNDPDVEEVR
jgi:antitoxin component HigA of HigAB toxin-antitoxin module